MRKKGYFVDHKKSGEKTALAREDSYIVKSRRKDHDILICGTKGGNGSAQEGLRGHQPHQAVPVRLTREWKRA